MGDARRGRRRRGRAVVARASRRSAARARRCRRGAGGDGRDRAAARGRAAAARQRARRAGRGRARARRLPPALERRDARERRVVRRPPAVDGPARALDPHRPGAAARHPARPRAAARAARRRAALHRRARPTSSSTAASGSSWTPTTSSCSSRAPRAGPPGIYLAALSLAGNGGQARARRGVRRHERPCRRLPRRRGARRPRAGAADASCCARRCSSACARRCATRSSDDRLGRRARRARALEPLPASPLDDHRRWFRFHHLFAQILRVELERREPGAGPRACTGARTSGTARSARPTRRSTTPSRRTAFAEAGAADRRDVGPLRQRGPDRVGARLARALPRGAARRRPAAAARQGVGRRRCAAARTRCAPPPPACARSAGSTRARCPDGFASLESSLSVLDATFGWGDVAAILDARRAVGRARGSPDSPWRPVITWALGWAHYCNGDLDAGRALAERDDRASRPPADQWIVGVAAIADLSLIAGMRGRRAEQLRLASEALDIAREHGLLDAVEDGEVHTALRRRARRARAATRRRCPRSRRASSCAGCGGSRSTSIDGLIALATTVAALGDRERAARAVRRGAGARRAHARDPGCRSPARRAARRPTAEAARAERAGADRPAAAGGELPSARSAGALPLLQHRPQPRAVDLPQARVSSRARRSRGPADC